MSARATGSRVAGMRAAFSGRMASNQKSDSPPHLSAGRMARGAPSLLDEFPASRRIPRRRRQGGVRDNGEWNISEVLRFIISRPGGGERSGHQFVIVVTGALAVLRIGRRVIIVRTVIKAAGIDAMAVICQRDLRRARAVAHIRTAPAHGLGHQQHDHQSHAGELVGFRAHERRKCAGWAAICQTRRSRRRLVTCRRRSTACPACGCKGCHWRRRWNCGSSWRRHWAWSRLPSR